MDLRDPQNAGNCLAEGLLALCGSPNDDIYSFIKTRFITTQITMLLMPELSPFSRHFLPTHLDNFHLRTTDIKYQWRTQEFCSGVFNKFS